MDIATIRANMRIDNDWIHFDNAGASLPPNIVHETIVNHLELERRIGGYAAKNRVEEELEGFYAGFSSLLNCEPTEIAFAENATRAWDMLAYSLPFRHGGRVLTGTNEYISNYLAFLQLEKRYGIRIDVVPNDDSGKLSVAALRGMIDTDVDLIAVTHVATSNGMINPAAEIGAVANNAGIPYLLDACQSAGQLVLDVQEMGCDMLTGTGRKFLRGPRGTGFLYVKTEFAERLDPVFIDLRSAEWLAIDEYRVRDGARRFETWESFVAGRLGLSKAVEYALSVGMTSIEDRTRRLADQLRNTLSFINGIDIRDTGSELSGIVTFSTRHGDVQKIKQQLECRGIGVTALEIGDARLDLERRGIAGIIRASVHYFNTEDEINRFSTVVEEIVHGV